MAIVEKISIVLPPDMIDELRSAVASGESPVQVKSYERHCETGN